MIRRFASLMDAVMWAAEQPRQCAPTDCDLDAPCRRHNSAVTLGARLWRRQLRRASSCEKEDCDVRDR